MVDIWEDNGIEIDPYLVGALIGDGSLSSDNFGFSNSEQDVISKVADLLKPFGLQLKKVPGDDNVDYDITLMDTAKYWYTYKGNTYKSLDQLKQCFPKNWANVYRYINAYNKKDWELAAEYSSCCVGLVIEDNPCRKGGAMLSDFLSRNGVNCKSINKSIPDNYLYSSIKLV